MTFKVATGDRPSRPASAPPVKPENGLTAKQRKNPIARAKENPKSLRWAIKAMCYHCQGGLEDGTHDPGWQWAVGNCAVESCPLRPHRPYQEKEGAPPEGVYRGMQ